MSGQPRPKITNSYNSVSGKHIAYLSITSCFSLFHLNPNLFFLLLATYYSCPHILDTLVLTTSIFPSLISNHPTEANIQESLNGHMYNFLLWQRNTFWFASHHNNITIMEYFIPENIHIICMDKLKTPPSSWTYGASCSSWVNTKPWVKV